MTGIPAQGLMHSLQQQVIIYLTDHKTCLRRKIKKVRRRARDLAKKRETKITLLPVGVGPYIDIRELEKVTKENNQDLNVIHVGEYENPDTIRKIIWRGKFVVFITVLVNQDFTSALLNTNNTRKIFPDSDGPKQTNLLACLHLHSDQLKTTKHLNP